MLYCKKGLHRGRFTGGRLRTDGSPATKHLLRGPGQVDRANQALALTLRQLLIRRQGAERPVGRLRRRNHLQLGVGQPDQDELEWHGAYSDTLGVCGPLHWPRDLQILHLREQNLRDNQQRRLGSQLFAHTVRLGGHHLLPRCNLYIHHKARLALSQGAQESSSQVRPAQDTHQEVPEDGQVRHVSYLLERVRRGRQDTPVAL